jgi:hypothetical protein
VKIHFKISPNIYLKIADECIGLTLIRSTHFSNELGNMSKEKSTNAEKMEKRSKRTKFNNAGNIDFQRMSALFR